MWGEPTKEVLSKIPKLYKTETTLQEKLIMIHFFISGTDFYIAEYDGDDLFWGFTILNNDFEMAEWGYISFEELKSIKVGPGLEVEYDQHWKVRKACDVDKIVKAQGWSRLLSNP